MKKRSLLIMGHATSISLEDEFWESLKEISVEKSQSIQELIEQIDLTRTSNLSSAVRLFVLNHLKQKLQEYKKQTNSK
ncbi:MAG: ribbon-helix-helix domain-containing protein [Alphaproteobacteria bacterium]|nr:ribbon-helix-helix domain-containing protein [Alphaproteobacteria bacterium]